MPNLLVPGDLLARAQIIIGLRRLADYLEDHPDLPVSEFGGEVTVYTDGADDEQRAEIDRIAYILGDRPIDDTDRDGHYTASKSFGRVTYRAIHIPSRARARHNAKASYHANIAHSLDHDNNPQDERHGRAV